MSVTEEYIQPEMGQPSLLGRFQMRDWGWLLAVIFAAGYVLMRFGAEMDGFEIGILISSGIGLALLGLAWRPLQIFGASVALLSLASVALYGDSLSQADTSFFLKFLLSSQTAIMWMSALFVMATFAYYFSLALRSDFSASVGTALTWSAAAMGMVGLFVRWRESYLMSPDIGHIPVSNLYEVFILFSIVTGVLYLFYEARYKNKGMGAFVLTVISAAVAFLLWYTFDRGANAIQPLVPALQSYWMKIHVPANFVGYGAFALAAMVGVAYLLRDWRERVNPEGLLASRLPSLEQLDDVMYKAIALGFAFFTVATVLGAMWAAEAWGGYWSWDPKETWALIVWLNYAAWLHLRLTKGWRGRPLAWWAIVGLFVTIFAFVGVNMFLSGLHSYGSL